MKINKDLKEYIEKNIFPIYDKNEKGHGIEHIKYVIERSLRFSTQFENINLDMIYTIAAFHDIAHHIDKDNHEVLSAEMFFKDEKMKEFFTDEQRIIIKEAIIDHRASLEYTPRSDYGKIISSADRTSDLEMAIKRTHSYNAKHFPNFSLMQMINRSYEYVIKKYGNDGYAKSYCYDEDFEKLKKDIETFKNDKLAFAQKYIEINGITTPYEEDSYIKDIIFDDNKEKYERLRNLHIQKLEIKSLKQLCKLSKPFVIEFTGTPRTGKTSTINNLYDFFKKCGFNVSIIEEFTTSKQYKEILKPKLEQMDPGNRDLAIIEHIYNQLLDLLNKDLDIILIDRSINDRQIWNYRRFIRGELDKKRYEEAKEKYSKISRLLIDFLVITYADPIISLKRDYNSSLSLEKRNFLNLDNLKEYNKCLKDLKSLFDESVEDKILLDTSSLNMQDTSILIAEQIMPAMRKKYINSFKQTN